LPPAFVFLMQLGGLAENIVSRQAAKLHKENKSRRQFMNICAKPHKGTKKLIKIFVPLWFKFKDR